MGALSRPKESAHTVLLVGRLPSRLLKGRDPVLLTTDSPALSTEPGTGQG